MKSYTSNPKNLLWLAPFNGLTLSSAYIVPFFVMHGLSMTQIMTLQSLFSVAGFLWEVPSGYLADRFGRALCIKLSIPLATVGLLAYGTSSHFWQFALCEVALALSRGLISGVQTALLVDSLAADGRISEYRHYAQRFKALEYASVALGVPVAFVLVRYLGVASTVVGDGVLAAAGIVWALRLREAPRHVADSDVQAESLWHATKMLTARADVRRLLALGSVLSAATYFGFWLSAPYYASVGLPVGLYGLAFALRSAFKAWLSHHFAHRPLEKLMGVHAVILIVVALCMALRQPWLAWAVLGHDVVQALHEQPITEQLNKHMAPQYRATLNSLSVLIRRSLYAAFGPLLGLAVDRWGVSVGVLVSGVICSAIAACLYVSLRRHRVFVAVT